MIFPKPMEAQGLRSRSARCGGAVAEMATCAISKATSDVMNTIWRPPLADRIRLQQWLSCTKPFLPIPFRRPPGPTRSPCRRCCIVALTPPCIVAWPGFWRSSIDRGASSRSDCRLAGIAYSSHFTAHIELPNPHSQRRANRLLLPRSMRPIVSAGRKNCPPVRLDGAYGRKRYIYV